MLPPVQAFAYEATLDLGFKGPWLIFSVLLVRVSGAQAPLLAPVQAFAYEATLDLGFKGTDGIFTVLDFRSDYHRTLRRGLGAFFAMDNMHKAVLPVSAAKAQQLAAALATRVCLLERNILVMCCEIRF